MALTTSNALSTAFRLPDFALPDVATGRVVTPSTFAGAKALVVAVICRHCPYVVHVMPELIRIAGEYLPRGIRFLGISANDPVGYPDDSPEKLAEMVHQKSIPFPVLHDASQQTARALRAVCTPEFYVFGPDNALFYHGRMDGSTPGNGIPPTGSELRAALEDLLAGNTPPTDQYPGMGCSIKWK